MFLKLGDRCGEIEDRECQGCSVYGRNEVSQCARDEAMFPEIVECAKGVEVLESARIGMNVGETRRQVVSARSSSESVESSGRKKPRVSNPTIQGQQGLKPPPCSKTSGVLLKRQIMCYRCHQSGHIRSQCPWRKGSCYSCGELGHMARICPRGLGVHGESSSVQQHKRTPKQQMQFHS
ncbi:hypothetical protein RHGRI_031078 [Rhododendron griersonianum]|uniref:CCHC-type domain-containing protein n=1 Tax=Rhododendron griersonianum TaxID=479676 RepID=A0AAV6I6Y3_9ERIC|nr:hypothetical protein RHGRI_031078 [Rhododendron griersonianum]